MKVRSVSRALLLTPSEEVLLIRIREPSTGWTAWITPGGGAAPGETAEQALRRELTAETGRDDFEDGVHVWHRDHTTTWEDVSETLTRLEDAGRTLLEEARA